jgi:hypothetical protein
MTMIRCCSKRPLLLTGEATGEIPAVMEEE